MITRNTTSKLIKTIIFLIIIVVIFGYIYFAFRDYISGPSLIISEPENGSIVHDPVVNIRGQALRIKEINLNNRPLLIDEEGNFTENLLLFPGYNIAVLTAIDKFGRTIEYKLELVYEN